MKKFNEEEKENNKCKNCGEQASYFSDENNGWLCEDCRSIEDGLDKLANKIEKKLSKRVYSFDLNELINCLSKDEIYNIARNLGVNKISGLNKEKLIETLLKEYKNLIEKRTLLFEEERYKILKSYVDSKGVKLFDDIDEEEADKSVYFIQQGMLFPTVKDGVSIFLMPEIVQALIKERNNFEYRCVIKFNSEIVNIFRAMNKVYGILKLKDAKEIIERYLNIENCELEELIREATYYYNEYREEGMFIVNNEIDNFGELLKDIDTEKDLSYTMISKEELLNMLEENWVYNSKAGKTFYKEFTNMFRVDRDMLIAMMEDLIFDVQENEPKDAVDKMIELINIENEEARYVASSMMNKFVRKIRLWRYKGSTTNDIKSNVVSLKANKDIKRNDPCPCGSGKKYKKCCGKDEKVINLLE
ncbi:zinc chelation protein SecC [Clostridium beijerinckii]|nr:zinc chelation protein SecC [Clostridium beijerinckii]MBC2423892.1 zinc chelation protein SecC [Clostridium beijerinckii]MBC2433435.1 zinc chelation protein SecC [Clostridium beijerinckii]MBC2490635.1 zinc chelation protein SecC [Clostridium beijerinckii]MBC2524341.1 zinc chelation protein SecC [Clostridium beijerinckii]